MIDNVYPEGYEPVINRSYWVVPDPAPILEGNLNRYWTGTRWVLFDSIPQPAKGNPIKVEDAGSGKPHQHRTREGLLVDCYHGSKQLLTDWRFWTGSTLGFPLEHFLYEKVWPFKLVTVWLGL